MKSFEDMDYSEQVAYVKGHIVLAIGAGTLDSFLAVWVDYIRRVGFKQGVKEGKRLSKKPTPTHKDDGKKGGV